MDRRLGGALLGLTLALGVTGAAQAQQWPAYGSYGYGAGFDYPRNPYSYPRPMMATSGSVPEETMALYGSYMPNAYYNGAAYTLSHANPFPSGQAYCQSAGSYLYCADIETGGALLLSMRSEESIRPRIGTWQDLRDSGASLSGLLNTRTTDGTTQLQGVLSSPSGRETPVDCAGALRGQFASLSCRTPLVTTTSGQ